MSVVNYRERHALHTKLFRAEMHQQAYHLQSLKMFPSGVKRLIYILLFPRRLKTFSAEFSVLFAFVLLLLRAWPLTARLQLWRERITALSEVELRLLPFRVFDEFFGRDVREELI